MRGGPADSGGNVTSESKPPSRKPKNRNPNAGIATTAQAEFNLLKHKVDEDEDDDEEDYSQMPELIEEACDIPKRSKMYEYGQGNFSIADCVIFSDLCIGDDAEMGGD